MRRILGHHVAGLSVVALTVMTSGCLADPAGPSHVTSGMLVRIDRATLDSHYSLLQVAFTLKQVAGPSDSVIACNGRPHPVFERPTIEGWEAFGGGGCNGSNYSVVLPVGASASDSEGMGGAVRGTYRLVFSYDRAGKPRIVSAPFVVP